MKILILTPNMPYPLNSGGNQAQFQMIDHMRDKIDITIAFLLSKGNQCHYNELCSKWPNVTFKPIFLSNFEIRLHTLIRYFRNFLYIPRLKQHFIPVLRTLLLESLACEIPFFVKRFLSKIDFNTFDLVQVEFYNFIQVRAFIPITIPTIFVHHELRYARVEQELNIQGIKSNYANVLFLQMKESELELLEKFDAIVVLSQNDADKLSLHNLNRCIFISPVSGLISNQNCNMIDNFQSLICFLGSGSHSPNLDALIYFLNEMWPGILSKNPNLVLHVVGSWDKPIKNKILADYANVHFTGFIADLNNELSKSILVVPLRIGSGIRIKILDAINAGAPVVTSSIGMEGLPLLSEIDCLIFDNPHEFSDAVIRLSQDSELRLQLKTSAQRSLQSEFSIDSLCIRRLGIYNQVVSISSIKPTNN